MTTTKEMPHARYDFLRYQVGQIVTRKETYPVYHEKKLIGHREGCLLASVFLLQGCGKTLDAAVAMAARSNQ